MKFEVRYPTGAQHEVELQGTVAILGRDPTCDLVLNDAKCSRRHAVVEAGPHGVAIRDTGSANGVLVNGQKVERASLKAGDVVRLGEVVLTVLSEDVPGTLVMGPEDIAELGAPGAPPFPNLPARPRAPAPPSAARPAPAPAAVTAPAPAVPAFSAPPPRAAPVPPPPRTPAERPVAAERPRPPARGTGPSGPIPRPLTVTVLALLWLASVPVHGAGGVVLAALGGWTGTAAVVALILGGLLALLGVAMGFGLWSRSPWAWILQLILAGLGLVTCVFTPVSAAILFYMLRPDVRIQFSGRGEFRDLSPGEAETVKRGSPEGVFTLAILGGLFLSLVMIGGLAFATGASVKSLLRASESASESMAIGRLRTMLSAQYAFRQGTCDGYADLEGLLNPSSVIPNYPVPGPAFLEPGFAQTEAAGYRYELKVEEPVPPTEGCPTRSFRRFEYFASPLEGRGRRSFLITADGVMRAAEGRPATTGDPPVN